MINIPVAHGKTLNLQDILLQATFYLFTNPVNCEPCKKLEEKLKASSQERNIAVQYKGNTYSLRIEKRDPWIKDADLLASYKKLGYLDDGIPQFSIVVGNALKGTGSPLVTLIEKNLLQDKDMLLPNQDESPDDYESRLNKLFEQAIRGSSAFDLSSTVINSIDPKALFLKANPDFQPDINATNMLIIGTASIPLNNPVFTGMVIDKVISSWSKITSIRPIVLYGTARGTTPDTVQVISQVTPPKKVREFVKFPLESDEVPSRENIVSFFKQVKNTKAKKNLIVLVGHGTPKGFPVWLELDKMLTPQSMKKLHHNSKATNVLVSGNCYGGIMARSVSCGFFAASPHLTASGCWEDAELGKDLEDYVGLFFKALSDTEADYNQDSRITFSEAHAYATIHGVDIDTPYTTIDALADEYFEKNPQHLAPHIFVRYIRARLQQYASPEESSILEHFINGMDSWDSIYLKDREEIVDLGPVTAKYKYSSKGKSAHFTDIKVTDLALLKSFGMPNGVSDLDLSLKIVNKNQVKLFYRDSSASRVSPLKKSSSFLSSIMKELEDQFLVIKGKTVNLGPVTATYEYNPKKQESRYRGSSMQHRFKDATITDLTRMKSYGLPDGTSKFFLDVFIDQNGDKEVLFQYQDLNAPQLLTLSSIYDDYIKAVKRQYPDFENFTDNRKGYISIDAFEGDIEFEKNYRIAISHIRVRDQNLFMKFLNNNSLPNDAIFINIYIFLLKDFKKINFYYKSKSKKNHTYKSLDKYTVDFNDFDDKKFEKNIKIGPFAAEVIDFSNDHVELGSVQVLDTKGFQQLKTLNGLPIGFVVKKIYIDLKNNLVYLYEKGQGNIQINISTKKSYIALENLDLKFKRIKKINHSLITIVKRLFFRSWLKKNSTMQKRVKKVEQCEQQEFL